MGARVRPWIPSLGAWPEEGGVRVRVWAPAHERVEAVFESEPRSPLPLEPLGDGFFGAGFPRAGPGSRYRYRLDGKGPFPDPFSRFQPEGVHGPSEVVDPGAFAWTDAGWRGVPLERLVLYELHVGTFTPEGTFAAAADRLPALRDLGVSAIELMPVADFPGERNWGYDGAALFAPARGYGRPDDLRRLVDAAHGLGVAVLLDVVFNHFGPDGAYAALFAPAFFSTRHRTPWGRGLDFDGENARAVRDVFVENALHWIHEYHLDGLRLDATHAIADESSDPFLAELARRVRGTERGRRALLVAEDHRNLDRLVRPAGEGGFGLDAVWSDDFHHQARRHLAGDADGYFRDFSGSAEDLATTVRRGWFYAGAYSAHFGRPRGTDPAGIPPPRFVVFLQNHDQVGNRAFGERLHHQVDLASWRAASVLLLLHPGTPLLFMGQEWAAGSPFHYFTDHEPKLGRRVTEGRREEFRGFRAFRAEGTLATIPDPQDPATFEASRLRWEERDREPHASVLRLYTALLRLRREDDALDRPEAGAVEVDAFGADSILLRREGRGGKTLLAVIRLRGEGVVETDSILRGPASGSWRQVLTTEESAYAPDPAPPAIELGGPVPVVRFQRPGAVLLGKRGQATSSS